MRDVKITEEILKKVAPLAQEVKSATDIYLKALQDRNDAQTALENTRKFLDQTQHDFAEAVEKFDPEIARILRGA